MQGLIIITIMEKDEKIQLLLDMQEHPEQFSEQALQTMLDDPEVRELMEATVQLKQAMMSDENNVNNVDAEWQRFAQTHLTKQKPERSWWKAAAMFIGILMISGIAFAAIHIIRHSADARGNLRTPTEETHISNSHQQTAETDTTATSHPKLYDNVPLGEIFKDLSDYYHVKVVYRNEDAPRLRLYYLWKPEYTLEKVMEMLNNFEWIQIQKENDTLFIRTTAIPAKDC